MAELASTRRSPGPVWTGRLLWGPGRMLYHGPGGPAERHRHHAVQLVYSHDEPFSLDLADGSVTARLAIIPSGAAHAVDTTGRRTLLALTEPAGAGGAALAARAEYLAGHDLGPLLDRPPSMSGDAASVVALADGLLDRLVPSSGWPTTAVPAWSRSALQPSAPVAAALAYLDDALDGRPRLADAARAAHLSPSRLTHVFSTEIGMPFRRYVLWLRLRRAAELADVTPTLAGAASAAGFSDLAHLDRVCRRTFGVSPSAVLTMEVVGMGSGSVAAS